jgi:hypothetical protein
MKQIELDFKSEQRNNPNLGEIINFSTAVGYMKYPRPIIERYFDKLVPKDNYMRKDREELLQGLFIHSHRIKSRGF